MKTISAFRRGLVLAAVASAVIAGVQAQPAYPDRPVRVIIPYPAGGSGDATVRFIAQKLSERWGQPVVVDNRPGGSGVIGTQAVERAARDGYTVLFTTTLHIQNEALGMKLPYDPLRDFVPIAEVLRSPATLVVASGTPAQTLKQYVELVRSQPGRHSFGSAGNATTSHLYGELFNRKAHLNAVHVPYKGGAPMMTDLLGGQISFSVIDAGSVMPMVKAGRARILAQTGTERSRMLPETPTFGELGLPGFEAYGWMGFFIARGANENVIARWETDVAAITRSPEYAALVNTLGMEPASITGEPFRNSLRNGSETWRKIAAEASISAE